MIDYFTLYGDTTIAITTGFPNLLPAIMAVAALALVSFFIDVFRR